MSNRKNDTSVEALVGMLALAVIFFWLVAIGAIIYYTYKWVSENPDQAEKLMLGLIGIVLFIIWLPELIVAYLTLGIVRELVIYLFADDWDEEAERNAVIAWLVVVPVSMTVMLFFLFALAIPYNFGVAMLLFLPYTLVTVLTYYILYFNVPPKKGGVIHPVWPRIIMAEAMIEFDIRLWFTQVVTDIRVWWHEMKQRWRRMAGEKAIRKAERLAEKQQQS